MRAPGTCIHHKGAIVAARRAAPAHLTATHHHCVRSAAPPMHGSPPPAAPLAHTADVVCSDDPPSCTTRLPCMQPHTCQPRRQRAIAGPACHACACALREAGRAARRRQAVVPRQACITARSSSLKHDANLAGRVVSVCEPCGKPGGSVSVSAGPAWQRPAGRGRGAAVGAGAAPAAVLTSTACQRGADRTHEPLCSALYCLTRPPRKRQIAPDLALQLVACVCLAS